MTPDQLDALLPRPLPSLEEQVQLLTKRLCLLEKAIMELKEKTAVWGDNQEPDCPECTFRPGEE